MNEAFVGLKIGDRVELVRISAEITDRNFKLKIGDTGTIVKFHADEYYSWHPQITVSWDRPKIGNKRTIDGREYNNCWAVSVKGIAPTNHEGYNPLTWKIKTMWERQPYMQKQVGVGK